MNYLKVLLFSGAFDPITNGHALMLSLSIQAAYFNEIWIMPSGKRTDKTYKASDKDRLKMCQIIADIYISDLGESKSPKIIVSDYEIRLDRTIDTYFTIKDLQLEYPDYDFYFLLGSDILPSMFSWPYSTELIEITKFFIVIREGYEIYKDDLSKLKRYLLLEDLLSKNGLTHLTTTLSSTIARKQLSEGMSCDSLGTLHPEVMRWIRDNNLYNIIPNKTSS